MSDTDSFIDEVNEEVRRDRMFNLFRRYGWIAVAAVLVLVGGAAWNEWRASQEQAQSEAMGDAIVAALNLETASARAAALQEIEATQASAIVQLLSAAQLASDDRGDEAVAQLTAVHSNEGLPVIYRQIAEFKSLVIADAGQSVETRRNGFESLISSGSALRVLSEEQLALLDIGANDVGGALVRLQRLLEDSEITPGVRRRVTQLITALGAKPGDTPTGD
ncbi:hypothetical protein OAL97_04145 [Paracoccaceae bacterium]|jgi:hypothetical protein|nr:hypothetical protein [Paracoccaceae bacterium]